MVRTLLLVLAVFLCGSLVSAQQAMIWLEPDTVFFQKNEFFYQHVMIDENLVGAKVFHLTLSFDKTVACIPPTTVELGDLFAGLESDTVTTIFKRLWPDSNHIDIDVAYLTDSATLDGPGELLMIPVVPKGFGETNIAIEEVLVFDRFNQQIPITVGEPTYARICQFVGDVNFDNSIDIRDIVYLVQYMFQQGPEPIPSVWSANFNCDNSPVDISDLVTQVSWMFQHGPWLCEPPCVNEP